MTYAVYIISLRKYLRCKDDDRKIAIFSDYTIAQYEACVNGGDVVTIDSR